MNTINPREDMFADFFSVKSKNVNASGSQNLLYLSKSADTGDAICYETDVKYTVSYTPPFKKGMTISGIPISGNVDSFRVIDATGDASKFIGKQLVIDDDNELRSVYNCENGRPVNPETGEKEPKVDLIKPPKIEDKIQQPKKDKSNTMLYAGIGVGLLALVGVVIYAVRN